MACVRGGNCKIGGFHLDLSNWQVSAAILLPARP
jgi:hypothetical protein